MHSLRAAQKSASAATPDRSTSPERTHKGQLNRDMDTVSIDMRRREIETKMAQITEVLAQQHDELTKLHEQYEKKDTEGHLRLGKKAATMMLAAEENARVMGHRAVGTGDILHALFHTEDGVQDSTAVKFLKKRGVTKESLYASHRYSDNAANILKEAQERATSLNKPVVGTEDLLWAIFQVDHVTSRSRAMDRLRERGVNLDLVWGNAILSENAQQALSRAIEEQREKAGGRQTVVGSEHLLEALFKHTNKDAKARHWMAMQHVQPVDVHKQLLKIRRTNSGSIDQASPYSERQEVEDAEQSLARMFAVGGAAGVIETFIVQPLVYWKTMQQIGKPVSFDPRQLYRGVFVNAASIGPISAVQYTTNGLLCSLHASIFNNEDGDSKMSDAETLAISASSGALSCAVVTPAELVMISQQRSGRTIAEECLAIWKSKGIGGFFRGNTATCLREAGWTFGFLGLAPVIKSWLQNDSKFFHRNDIAASLASSLVAGQGAALLTQPFDQVKTVMQADRGVTGPMKHKSFISAAKAVYDRGGIQDFWKGIVPRSGRCIAAVFILGETQYRLSQFMEKYKILMPVENGVEPDAGITKRQTPPGTPPPPIVPAPDQSGEGVQMKRAPTVKKYRTEELKLTNVKKHGTSDMSSKIDRINDAKKSSDPAVSGVGH